MMKQALCWKKKKVTLHKNVYLTKIPPHQAINMPPFAVSIANKARQKQLNGDKYKQRGHRLEGLRNFSSAMG